MKIIKFGGTAFQTPKLVDNICNIIIKEEKPLVVVVSAIGRRGFPFATDTLIDSMKDNYLSKKEMDRLLSLGEIYSSLFLTNALKKHSINVYPMSYLELGIECDDNYQEGNIICISDEKYKELLKGYDVIIVPGFIGASKEKEVITLGRGTSDLTTIELAKLFKLKKITLYKEVDGIYPTLFANLNRMHVYENLSYDEVLSLIDIGFSPINKKAILEAKQDNIIIEVRNFLINNKKTIISNKASKNRIIGFNVENNKVIVATKYVDEVIDELIEILKKHHIYIKLDEKENTYFSFKISVSQILLIRQIILKTYFFDMLIE